LTILGAPVMRRLAFVTLILSGAIAAFDRSPSQPAAAARAEQGKPKVVATFSVLGDLISNVAGDKIELVTLVGPDSDTHVYEPKPRDAVAIANAVAIFEIGIGLEHWLDKLYKSSSSKAQRLVVSKGLTLLEGSDDENDKKDVKKAKEEDKDPHVWHDVKNTIHMVERIRDHLVKVDPANAAYYQSRAFEYSLKLRELDLWVFQQVADVPRARRKLVTNHDTFNYFAKRYGFEIVGDALGSTSTEGAEPSPKEIAKLIAKIKAAKVPVIFAENIESNKLIKRLAKEAGVRVGPELFTDALGKAGSQGETFEKMVRYNVTAIVTELSK
jgi:zinc/manganese transport system substrate-binding protein